MEKDCQVRECWGHQDLAARLLPSFTAVAILTRPALDASIHMVAFDLCCFAVQGSATYLR